MPRHAEICDRLADRAGDGSDLAAHLDAVEVGEGMEEQVVGERGHLVALARDRARVAFALRVVAREAQLQRLGVGADGRDGRLDIVRERRHRRLALLHGLGLGGAGALDLGAHVVEGPGEASERIAALVGERGVEVARRHVLGERLQTHERAHDADMEVRDDAPCGGGPEHGEQPDERDGKAAPRIGGRSQRLLRPNQRRVGLGRTVGQLRAGRVQLHHLRAHPGLRPVVHEHRRGRERRRREGDRRGKGDADEPPCYARALARGRHDAQPASKR